MIKETCEKIMGLPVGKELLYLSNVNYKNAGEIDCTYVQLGVDTLSLQALVTALREYQQRAEAAEKVIDHYAAAGNWRVGPQEIFGRSRLYCNDDIEGRTENPYHQDGFSIAREYRDFKEKI